MSIQSITTSPYAKAYLAYWEASYKEDLTHDIMPFWLEHGLDREHGGVYTCVDRAGKLIDPTKSVWFQGRFAFTCCFAYNHVEKNPAWLEAAKSTLDFIEAHCFDSDGRMYFEVMADGTPLRKRRYVFSESFAAIAMAEYAKATGDSEYARKALALFKDMRRFLSTPGILEPKYLPGAEVSAGVPGAGAFDYDDYGECRFLRQAGGRRPGTGPANRRIRLRAEELLHASRI